MPILMVSTTNGLSPKYIIICSAATLYPGYVRPSVCLLLLSYNSILGSAATLYLGFVCKTVMNNT